MRATLVSSSPSDASYPARSAWPALEWECLTFAQHAQLLGPAPLALDQDGDWFGTPSIVMEVVPGRPDLKPINTERYVEDVARTLADVHAAPASGVTGALVRAHAADGWIAPDPVPNGLIVRQVAERMVAAIAERLPRVDTGGAVLNHGDFHPGNLLWSRGRLTGIVDWPYARIGPRWWELAYMRMEVALLVDARAADRLLGRYQTLVCQESPDQPVWDLVCLYNAHRSAQLWLTGYHEQGRRDLTVATMRRRLTRLARRALTALGT